MTVTHGMDTDAGRRAGADIRQGADQITDLAQRLDTVLMSFDWTGTDAERVRDSWREQERPALDATAQHLAALAVLLDGEAQAQDQASGTEAAAGGHLGALLAGLLRTGDGVVDFESKVVDVLTGRRDWSVAALAASALSTVGAAAGAVVGAITGEDPHWFAEGPGLAGDPVAAPTDPSQAGQFHPVVARPTDLPSLMQGVTDSYQVGAEPGSNGDVRITRVDNGSGTPAYVVSIPGTESWSPSAGATGRDLTANLHLVAGNPTAAAQSVELAMQRADIPPGAPVMLVGHSQGGIIAATLASDRAFVERYGVTNVLTYGAPIDHVAVDPSVRVLQVQHGLDIVPRLDLGGITTSDLSPDRQPVVTLDSPGQFWQAGVNHSYVEYAQSVRDELGADTDAGRILREYQASLSPFFVTPGGSVSAVDVPVSRGGRP
ncbi:hypothetical protein [Nocardioides caricicola]|uniref:GPI inositol-deacylase PGAP1-like alpha/beta domain-containing protein n=1 Tax=Nocardioides caricicola TaxID=634770 RepID=A0ABW0N5X9_9ACTN